MIVWFNFLCNISPNGDNNTERFVLIREAQEKRFDTEKANLIKYYDTELDQLYRQQKQQIEKSESSQETDMRMTAKKIKADQVSS